MLFEGAMVCTEQLRASGLDPESSGSGSPRFLARSASGSIRNPRLHGVRSIGHWI
jgi:hypothetical protein